MSRFNVPFPQCQLQLPRASKHITYRSNHWVGRRLICKKPPHFMAIHPRVCAGHYGWGYCCIITRKKEVYSCAQLSVEPLQQRRRGILSRQHRLHSFQPIQIIRHKHPLWISRLHAPPRTPTPLSLHPISQTWLPASLCPPCWSTHTLAQTKWTMQHWLTQRQWVTTGEA